MRIPLAPARVFFLAAYTRHVPVLDFVRHGAALGRLRERIMAERRVIRLNRAGLQMDLDIRHGLDLLVWINRYERGVRECVERLVRPGDVVVDGGAHIGTVTLPAAIAAGSTGRVLAFEPAPEARSRLAHHVRLNGLPQVSIRREGLGSVRGNGVLRVTEDPGFSSLGPTLPRGGGSQPVEVPLVTVDDVCAEEGISRIALLKLDIEGGEVAALRGGARMLEEGRVDAVIVEYNRMAQTAWGFTHDDLPELLRSTHPAISCITPRGCVPLRDTPLPAHAELLCLPAGRTPPRW
jgi:FkbM family methyltransferase